jgi:hypothetical protein
MRKQLSEMNVYIFSVYPYEGDKRIFKVKARTRANAYEKARYKNPFVDLIELDTIEL